MANENIQAVTAIKVSDAQAKAIRKLALRNSKYDAAKFAQVVFDRAVKNSFSPLVKSIGEDAKKKYAAAIAGGFPAPTYKNDKGELVPITADEYAKRAKAEYADILSELGDE